MIKKLDEQTIGQIAAGEIIEGPASVVKELVENSIDAKSEKIEVSLQKAGKKSIIVIDDGEGMSSDNVPIALERHATSKISNSEDLNTLSTLGFRGEALPSIAAVSELTLETKSPCDVAGIRAVYKGGHLSEIKEAGLPQGTMVQVDNLFYNLPARKKFMRKDSSEMQKIITLMHRFCFSYPQISFSLTSNNRLLFNTNGRSAMDHVIKKIFGQNYYNEMLKISYQHHEFSLSGFIGKPGFSRPHRREQYFFVNNRIVMSDLMRKALEKGYHGFLMSKQYPAAILNINIPPNMIDVNIHPSKMEIRFKNRDDVFEPLVESIKSTLEKPHSAPVLNNSRKTSQSNINYKPIVSEQSKITPSDSINESPFSYSFTDTNSCSTSQKDLEKIEDNFPKDYNANIEAKDNIADTKSNDNYSKLPDIAITGQFLYSYITGTMGDEFVFIDQHAAHERILFERYLEEYNSRDKSLSQQLINPTVLEMQSYLLKKITANIELFSNIGFKIEDFGDNTVIFRAVPAYLQDICSDAFLISIVEDIADNDLTSIDNLKNKIIILTACKGAIKAGQKLHINEMTGLIKDLRNTKNPFTCPHGRPTLIRVTKCNLDALFKRSGGQLWHE